jgi:hypothetical protein
VIAPERLKAAQGASEQAQGNVGQAERLEDIEIAHHSRRADAGWLVSSACGKI